MRSTRRAPTAAASVAWALALALVGCDDATTGTESLIADTGAEAGDTGSADLGVVGNVDAAVVADDANVEDASADMAAPVDDAGDPDMGAATGDASEADLGVEADAGGDLDALVDVADSAVMDPDSTVMDPDMGGDPPGPGLRGGIFMTEITRAGGAFATLEAGAEFARFARAAVEAPAEAVAGDCNRRASAPGDPGEFNTVSVGDITVSGGPEADVTMAYLAGAGAYVFDAFDPNAPLDFWLGGESITLAAAGSADFGAFSAEVAAPTAAADVSPNAQTPFSRAGTTVTWTPGTASSVIVRLRAGDVTIECLADDGGAVDVPAAAMGWLPAEAATVTFSVHRFGQMTIQSAPPVGEVKLTLEAAWLAGEITLEN